METKNQLDILSRKDNKTRTKTGCSSSMLSNANNRKLVGESTGVVKKEQTKKEG